MVNGGMLFCLMGWVGVGQINAWIEKWIGESQVEFPLLQNVHRKMFWIMNRNQLTLVFYACVRHSWKMMTRKQKRVTQNRRRGFAEVEFAVLTYFTCFTEWWCVLFGQHKMVRFGDTMTADTFYKITTTTAAAWTFGPWPQRVQSWTYIFGHWPPKKTFFRT